MAQINKQELKYTDTGMKFYPVTHVDAVVGLAGMVGRYLLKSEFNEWVAGAAITIGGYQIQPGATVSLSDIGIPSWAQQQSLQFSALPALYIGTTAVQSSNTPQALEGILSIKKDTSDSLFEWEPSRNAWHFHGNLYADGYISAGGIGSGGGGGGGGASVLNDLDDVSVPNPSADDILSYNGTSHLWVSLAKSSFLSGYATQSWVQSNYISSETDPVFTASPAHGITAANITSWNSKVDSSALSDYALKTGESTYNFLVNTLKFSIGTLAAQNYTISSVTKPRPKWTYTYNGSSESKYLAYYDEIPTALKCPQKLYFGSNSGTFYDGSTERIITASSLGALTSVAFSDLTTHPTTLSGYGITDAKIANGVITLGSNTITPITQIYTLTLNSGSFSSGTYTPNSAAKTFNIPTTLDHISDGSTRKLSNYLPLSGGTMTGALTMRGANILTYADSTNQIGAVDRRFQNGYIRNVYLTYLGFRSDDGATQVGNFGMGTGYAQITINASPSSSVYTFNGTYGFFHGGNGDVPCGRSDHRWSELWTVNADISGGVSIGGDIVPATDLGSQLGYSTRRFSNASIVNVYADSIRFKHYTTGNNDGLISGNYGYMRFRTGENIDSSYKDIVFHESYGFYPEQANTNLGYNGANYRWSTIYGVNEDLTGNISFRSSGSGNKSGLITAEDGYLVLRSGANIDSSYKQVILHATYGLSPSTNNDTTLGYSTARWSTMYAQNANLSGSLTLSSSSYIDIGPIRIKFENNALHITKVSSSDTVQYGIYADGFVSAGGIQQ